MKELIQSVIICIAMFSFSPHFEGYNVTMLQWRQLDIGQWSMQLILELGEAGARF